MSDPERCRCGLPWGAMGHVRGCFAPSAPKHFVPISCREEYCRICGAPAAHKVSEEIFNDDPVPNRHPHTAYVCCHHFIEVMGSMGAFGVCPSTARETMT